MITTLRPFREEVRSLRPLREEIRSLRPFGKKSQDSGKELLHSIPFAHMLSASETDFLLRPGSGQEWGELVSMRPFE